MDQDGYVLNGSQAIMPAPSSDVLDGRHAAARRAVRTPAGTWALRLSRLLRHYIADSDISRRLGLYAGG